MPKIRPPIQSSNIIAAVVDGEWRYFTFPRDACLTGEFGTPSLKEAREATRGIVYRELGAKQAFPQP